MEKDAITLKMKFMEESSFVWYTVVDGSQLAFTVCDIWFIKP